MSGKTKKLGRLTVAFAAATIATITIPMHEESETSAPAPEVTICVSMSDLSVMTLPSAATLFNQLSIVPITGEPLFETLTDPAHHMQFCEVPNGSMVGAGTYSGHTLRVSQNTGRTTAAHEGFHAQQDVNDTENWAWSNAPQLTTSDQLTVNLLTEATAVAYTYIHFKEADDYLPGIYTDFRKGRDPVILEIFEAAYAEAETKFTDKAKILEYAGQAVAQALMDDKNVGWSKFYKPYYTPGILAAKHAAVRDPDAYDTLKRTVIAIGQVSDDINLIPPRIISEFIGPKPIPFTAPSFPA
jgi:hypothetical protein